MLHWNDSRQNDESVRQGHWISLLNETLVSWRIYFHARNIKVWAFKELLCITLTAQPYSPPYCSVESLTACYMGGGGRNQEACQRQWENILPLPLWKPSMACVSPATDTSYIASITPRRGGGELGQMKRTGSRLRVYCQIYPFPWHAPISLPKMPHYYNCLPTAHPCWQPMALPLSTAACAAPLVIYGNGLAFVQGGHRTGTCITFQMKNDLNEGLILSNFPALMKQSLGKGTKHILKRPPWCTPHPPTHTLQEAVHALLA